MALSKKDQAAVAAAAKAGGLKNVSVSSGGQVSASNSKASSSSTPAPVVSTPTVTRTTTSTPIATPGTTVGSTMGTTAKDPAKNVSAPSTSIAPGQIASGISINSSGGINKTTPTTSSNAQTANLLMTSYPGATTNSGTSQPASNYTGGSIVDYLSSVGKPSDFSSRAALASQNGIVNYSGTADQNLQLLNKLRTSGGGSTGATTSSSPSGTGYSATGTTVATGTTGATDTTSYGIDKTTGLPVGPGNDPKGSAPVTPTGTTTGTPSPYSAPNTGLYGQLITDQANRAKGNNEYDKAAADFQKAVADRNALKQSMDTELANIDLEPGTLHFQQGRKQVLSQLYAQKLADADARVTQAQQGMQYATSQYGAESTALQGAIGAAGQVLQGGQYMPFGGDGATMQAGIANATKWAIAQQNMAQGANYQGQAQELSNALQAMQPLGTKLTSFMTQAGLNPYETPILNQPVNTIDAQLHPEAVATMNAAMNDIRSYAIQILGSQSGANPTDVTAAVSSFDFSSMTPTQLTMLFRNLENMGMVRLSQAQSASQAGYNANLTGGGAAAQGMNAQDLGNFQSNKTPSSDVNNALKILGGVAAPIVSNAAQGAANAAGNVLSGLAARVLAL